MTIINSHQTQLPGPSEHTVTKAKNPGSLSGIQRSTTPPKGKVSSLSENLPAIHEAANTDYLNSASLQPASTLPASGLATVRKAQLGQGSLSQEILNGLALVDTQALEKILSTVSTQGPGSLKTALVNVGVPPAIAGTFKGISHFMDTHDSFHKGYNKFIDSIEVNSVGEKIPANKIFKSKVNQCLNIATDEMHPQKAFATLHLVLVAGRNAFCNAFPDIRALVVVKQLSSALDSQVKTQSAQPFAQNYQHLLTQMPNGELIKRLEDTEYHDFHSDFIGQLAKNMEDGSFKLNEGSAAGIALQLGKEHPALLEPSIKFVQNRLADFASKGILAPAQSFANNADAPQSLQTFAQALVAKSTP